MNRKDAKKESASRAGERIAGAAKKLQQRAAKLLADTEKLHSRVDRVHRGAELRRARVERKRVI